MFEMIDIITGWIIPLGLILIILSGIVALCEVFKERNEKRETEKRSLLSAMFAAASPIEDGESEDEYSERIHTAVGLYLRAQEDKIWKEAKQEYRNLFGSESPCGSCTVCADREISCGTCVNSSENVQTA